MALTALIGASESLVDGELRALALVGGETLIERQAGRLAKIGVEKIYVAVSAIPPDLLVAFDRIRKRGFDVMPVRAAPDLLGVVNGTDRILLVADGLQAGPAHFSAIAHATQPTILVTGDTPLTRGFERIDAQARWGGLALISPDIIRELADMPGGWDMQLTLLRLAVQTEATRLYCEPALFEQGDITIIADRSSAALLEQSSLQQVEYGGLGMGRAGIFMPLARLLGPLLVRSAMTARYLPVVTGILWLGVLVLAIMGLPFAAAIAALFGCFGLAAMRFLSAFRAESSAADRIRTIIRSAALLLLALFPWLLAFAQNGRAFPILADAALAPCLAAAILLARWLYAEMAETRRFHWLLPDADQAWLMLVPALAFGFAGLMFAILPLLALFQILLWVRLARQKRV